MNIKGAPRRPFLVNTYENHKENLSLDNWILFLQFHTGGNSLSFCAGFRYPFDDYSLF